MKKIAVSIHDVTPGFNRELDYIFNELDRRGVVIRSELVVPDFQRANPLQKHPEFTAMLKEHHARGIDVSLHGIYHDYAEFFRFDYTAARDAISQGLEVMAETLNIVPAGFVAPQWLQSRGSLRAVREAGFGYTATLSGVYFDNGRGIKAFPINYDWGLVPVDHLFSWCNGLKCRWRRGGLIRVSFHPMDVTNRMIGAELRHLDYLLEHGWEPTSYAGLRNEVCND